MQVHPKQASQYTIDGVLVIPSEEKESWLQGQAPAGGSVLAGDGLPHRGISEQSSEGKKAGGPTFSGQEQSRVADSQGTGPQGRAGLECCRNTKETHVAGVRRERGDRAAVAVSDLMAEGPGGIVALSLPEAGRMRVTAVWI